MRASVAETRKGAVNQPMTEGFSAYYDATEGRPPRPTLMAALARFGAFAGAAVDLGCGDGRDTIELLRRGWSVLGIDAEADAIRRLRARADLPPGARLETRVGRFETADWPKCDLVNASFSLPLCAPDAFGALWKTITASLDAGGRFCGQLYGLRDDWAGRPGVTHHSRDGALSLLAGLEVEMFEEEESDAVTPRGARKHWHIFHIVARLR